MEVVDLVESEDELALVTHIERGHLKRKSSGSADWRRVKNRAHDVDDHCSFIGGHAWEDQEASIALALKLQREEENAELSLRSDQEYARCLQQEEGQEKELVLIGQSSLPVAAPSPDDDASLALAQKLQEEEEQQEAKRRAMLEEESSSQPDMVAARICEAVRQLPGNAERPAGSCVNYDCARAFFAKHKAFLDASRVRKTPIQIVYHGTPQNSDVFRSIVHGNLRVPVAKGQRELANRSAYGVGIYTTPDPEAAYHYSEEGPIFMCLALPGRIYFCRDSEHKRGQPKMKGFNSHASPCQQVLVIFGCDQILPVFLMERTHQAKAHQEILQILGAIENMTGNRDSRVPYKKEEGDGITQESFRQKLQKTGTGRKQKKYKIHDVVDDDWGWRPARR